MTLDSVLKFLEQLNLLAEVTENGDLSEVNDFIVKYLKGKYFESRNEAVQFIEDKFINARLDRTHMVYAAPNGDRYYFGEDLNGKYMKDLQSGSTLYPPALLILDDYYGIYD